VPFARSPRPTAYDAVSDASPVPFWLDSPQRPAALDPLVGALDTDLLVVGGGFSGLWTALLAKEADPGRDVVVLEGSRIGWAASGRNGGFCSASVTHGFANGLSRWPDELTTLVRLGQQNLDGIAATLQRYGIDCSFERTGELDVATEAYQLEGADELVRSAADHGLKLELLDRDQLRARVDSPLYLGGVSDPDGVAMLDPARLAWGLRDACLSLGVRIHEGTRATGFGDDRGRDVVVTTESDAGPGLARAGQVVLATNAFPPLLARLKHLVLPVYDYVIVTEPLTDDQWSSIGWQGREGIGDSGNQFHYYRRTDDGRILFGGYDAIYHRNNGMGARYDQHRDSFALLAEHLVEVFPSLQGVRASHAWGGAIDTCSRFSAFFGTARDGRVAYAAGYTGLGVGATRFGAAVMLDLLAGADTERTRSRMVRTTPVPFPPEPFRSVVVDLTRRSLDAADRSEGRRNLWLRTLDRLGLGVDT
jgi:glycine/D-amino acid oxidase-like deaminating enzyme